MTDIIDYNVGSLTTRVFDSRQSIIAPLPGETQPARDQNYVDMVTLLSLLTSSKDIDYQFITDFFLTCRSFISQESLLRLLVLRLKWCFQCIDDSAHELKQSIGKLTLVRTFVVIRHWLLNYFSEDFIVSEPLRQLFISEVNLLTHSELFVQRVISNLKKNWTSCCNRAWDEKVISQDFYTFTLKVGPQSARIKRLSTIALNQKMDPMTRNSMILSLYDQNTIHKLPLPLKHSRREPKLPLNPKNSILRLSMSAKATAPACNPALLRSSNTSAPSSSNAPLYVPLSNVNQNTKSMIRDETKFPKSSQISKVLPPTPVKKMDIFVPLPPSNKPQPKGWRPLIENWLKTFSLGNTEKTDVVQGERFMASVVSVAKIDNKDLEKLAQGKFDILSARTIDELEYLVRFHNELVNRNSLIHGTESFSFTIDEPTQRISNIDNLNLYGTISNISKTVLSIQRLQIANRSSHTSSSAPSKTGTQDENNTDSRLRTNTDVKNMREFNFENDESCFDSSSTGVISASTPHETSTNSIVEDDDEQQLSSDEQNEPPENMWVIDECRSGHQPHKHNSEPSIRSATVSLHGIRPMSAPIMTSATQFTKRLGSPAHALMTRSTAVTPEKARLNRNSAVGNDKPNGVLVPVHDVATVGVEPGSGDSDLDSFTSTMDDVEDMDTPESMDNYHSDVIDNEPSTPPSEEGIITSTPQISPIKSLQESHHASPIKTIREQHMVRMTTTSLAQMGSKHDLDLNRMPSFTRISNGTLSSHTTQHDRTSYLSKRSFKSHRASNSVNSIFSGTMASRFVNVAVKQEANDDLPPPPAVDTQSINSNSVEFVDSTINSDDMDVKFPMNGVNSHMIAELAAISDDSYQHDPIQAALSKLEGNYTRSGKRRSVVQSVTSSELNRQVEDLAIHTPVQRSGSAVIDQRRKTRLFSLTPVRQKEVVYDQSSSKILLELLLSHKVTNDILKIENSANHLSFIMNYDSKTIAQQMTLIERDALLEIDWKELVDLTWESDKLEPINSWLALLVQNEDIQGVDLCSSRFNLTVNWIISEILLTKDRYLQKLTIQRFIHIAQNCKELQNFSTMMQIILALISSKVMSLKETWRMVEPGDILIFKNLENLCSPNKNFTNLRTQLNDIKPSVGCVPFIGLYLSDLYFNNREKKGSKGGLINFGKFKMTAKIVRSLIQCIQWSMLYKLECNEEVLSKCLYIKALTEEEMTQCMTESV